LLFFLGQVAVITGVAFWADEAFVGIADMFLRTHVFSGIGFCNGINGFEGDHGAFAVDILGDDLEAVEREADALGVEVA